MSIQNGSNLLRGAESVPLAPTSIAVTATGEARPRQSLPGIDAVPSAPALASTSSRGRAPAAGTEHGSSSPVLQETRAGGSLHPSGATRDLLSYFSWTSFLSTSHAEQDP